MDRIIAYCGLTCSDCSAYLATQANDQAALERVAAEWRQIHSPQITVADVPCDGCLTGARKCSHCATCNLRACGVAHGVANCAACPEYGCEKITAFFDMVPQARTTLEALRSAA